MMDEQFDDTALNAALDKYESVAPALATSSLDKNPEDGARALEISKATGAPPEAIFDDLEAYDNELKAGLTHQIVSSNYEIAKYIRENPLADVVSNDDYGNMEKFSQTVPGAGIVDTITQPLIAGLLGSAQGVYEGLTAPPAKEDVKAFEAAGPAMRYAYGGYDIGKRLIEALAGGISGGVTGFAGKVGEELGQTESEIEKTKREALDLVNMAFAAEGFPLYSAAKMPRTLAPKPKEITGEVSAADAAKPWVDSSMEPPTGMHPEIDQAKANVNIRYMEGLYENHAAALEMLTRERSPEHAEAFIKQFYGSSSIGISGDRIAELYGDTVPEAGDGLLGWVPDLEQKLADAVSIGGDVHIPLALWLAKVDPQVAEGLKPFVRVWGGGITEAEASVKVEPMPVVDAPMAQVRAAMGTEPVFGLGDRKLTLEAGEGKLAVLDETGNVSGDITVLPEGETLRIQSITGEVGADIETIGPSALVDVVKQIKEVYPEAKEVVIGREGPQEKMVGLPPVPEGHIRFFHGAKSADKPTEGRWVSSHFEYARDWNRGDSQPNHVWYFDMPETSPEIVDWFLDQTDMKVPRSAWTSPPHFEASFRWMKNAKLANVTEIETIPLDTTKPLTPETYNKTKYALSRIYDEKLVSEIVPETEFELPETSVRGQVAAVAPTQAGLTKKSFGNLRKLLLERHDRDVRAALERAERIERRTQTKEWKAAAAEVRASVAEKIGNRPDVLADMLIGAGELGGEKLKQRYPLREDSLTAEQKAGLPKHYYSKDGLVPDQVAGMFGFTTGDSLVNALVEYNKGKGELSSREHLAKVIEDETIHAMNWMHGKLDENIMRDAVDHALSETDLNLIAEEWQGAAMQAGEAVISKELAKAEALEAFGRTKMADVSFVRLQDQALKHYRTAVDALGAGDVGTALVSLERRYRVSLQMAEMKKLEKLKAADERLAKVYSKAVDPTKRGRNIDASFDLFNREIYRKTQRKFGMSEPWLAEEISKSGFTDLRDFVEKTEEQNQLEGLELPVPDFLLDPAWSKSVDDMTVAEFREIAAATKGLDKIGKALQKIIIQGQQYDLDLFMASAKDQLAGKFPEMIRDLRRPLVVKDAWNKFWASSTVIETLCARFDGRNKNGLFTNMFIYPGFEASNYRMRLRREIGELYKQLGKIEDGDKLIDHPFVHPKTGTKIEGFTRRNLAAVISNMGNKYNWDVFCKGWKVDPDAAWNWVMQNARMEDFERAEKMSKIFGKLFELSSNMYRQMYGKAPDKVLPRAFTATLADGSTKDFAGWYHPIIGDPVLSRFVNKMPDMHEEYGYWPSTFNSYTKRRTGAIQVIDLTYDSVPHRMEQMIHDIAMKEYITNASKVLRDNRFREMITTYYGKDYLDVFDHSIESMAGKTSKVSGAMALANKMSGDLRQNVISTQIAFNIGTVQKHGSTAWLYSAMELDPNLLKSIPQLALNMAEVTPSFFKHAAYDLFNGSQNLQNNTFKFIRDSSEEIQARERNILESAGGQHKLQEPGGRYAYARNQMMVVGAKAVAWSDMLSAAPLWLAKYRQEMQANGGDHLKAVQIADAAVRRAHGSMSELNRPMITGGNNPVTPWITSLYGFMGTSLQRRLEILHDLNDAYKLGMKGDINESTKHLGRALAGVAVYIVWTGYIEEKVTSQFTEDKRGLGEKTAMAVFGGVSNAIIGLRDLYKDIEYGTEAVGLSGTIIHDLTYFGRDVRKAAEKRQLTKAEAGKLVRHGITLFGDFTGLGPKHLGTVAGYGIDVFNDYQRPRKPEDWYRGLVTGEQKLKVKR